MILKLENDVSRRFLVRVNGLKPDGFPCKMADFKRLASNGCILNADQGIEVIKHLTKFDIF